MKGKVQKIFCLLSLLFATGSGLGQLTTIQIPVSFESYIDNQYPTTNYGSDTIMEVGTYTVSSTTYYKRSFLKFDLSSIPTGAVVNKAHIIVFHYNGLAGSNPLRIKRVTDQWYEDTITANNQPAISTNSTDISSTYTMYTDSAKLNVGFMTKWMHFGLLDNYGWDIEVLNETDTSTTGIEFYTREASDTNKRPYLLVEYYYPIEAQNIWITHESANGAEDGVIDLDLIHGSEDFTYEWIDGFSGAVISTDTILDSLSYGWYGLHATGTYGEEFYQAFIVGLDCDTVDITFMTWPDYTSSAYISDAFTGAGIDESKNNYGGSQDLLTTKQFVNGVWSRKMDLMKFHLYIDEHISIDKADLTLYGKAHQISNWRTNKADFVQITEDWLEDAVTYNNQPDTSNRIILFVDSVSTTTQNRTIDATDFFDFWKAEQDSNFGMYLRLQDYTTQFNVKQHYYSPDASDTTKHPIVEFTINLSRRGTPYHCHPVYASVQPELSGANHRSQVGYLYFSYDNEYESDSTYLNYNVYGSGDFITPALRGDEHTLPLDYGRNQYALDVTGLAENESYILEVINDKGETFYLRFNIE